MSLKNIQGNVPKVDLSSYKILLYGEPKSGKTTLYNDIGVNHFGKHEDFLLLALEKGYNAIRGIHAQDIEDWDELVSVIDELVDEKDELPYKMVGIDTIGVLVKMASDHVVADYNRKTKKPVKTVGDIPHGKGWANLDDVILKQLKRLDNAGYGVVYIGHSKDKKFTSQSGEEYNQITVDLTDRVSKIFVNQADFIVYLNVEKIVKDGKATNKRSIHFRSDGDVLAGTRFKEVPEKIDYDADQFLDAFKEAVQSAHGGNSKEMEKDKEEELKKREEKAKEFAEKENEADPEELKTQIQNIIELNIENNGKSSEQLDTIKEIVVRNVGKMKYKEPDVSTESLESVLQELLDSDVDLPKDD